MLKTLLKRSFVIVLLFSSNISWLQDPTGHLYFDGVNDYVETHNTRLDYVNDNFTFEAIIKGNEAEQGVNPTIISNRWSPIKGSAFYLKNMGDGPRALCFLNRGEEWYVPNNGSIGSLLDGECHHVALVRNDGDIFFYADGVLFGMIYDPTCANNLQGFHSIWIGRDHYYDNEFKGVIGNVRVWNLARTATEIAENMFSSMDGTEPGIRGCWELNEGDGQQVLEETMYGWSGFLGTDNLEGGDGYDPDWFPGDYCADIGDYGHGDDDGWVEEEDEEEDDEEDGEEDDNDNVVADQEISGLANNSFAGELAIYPNPISTDLLTIDFGTERNNVSLILSTLNGQNLITNLISEETSQVQLNVNNLAAGVYLLIISHDAGSLAKKIIIN